MDALDTLLVMGNTSEFRRSHELLIAQSSFNIDVNTSVFEANIRVVGGLLSAHLLSPIGGVPLAPGWPCEGPLLNMAESLARRLLPGWCVCVHCVCVCVCVCQVTLQHSRHQLVYHMVRSIYVMVFLPGRPQ